MMNIYWFASEDCSVIEPILAHDEETARKILFAKEDHLQPEDYELAGVSSNVGEGGPRALAEILNLHAGSELNIH
jgi:hypothetical protein